ncbi:Chitooligosaccharide oxidase like protein [Verticillium longisporum]
MDSTFSLRRLAVASLLSLTPSAVSAQTDKSAALQSCLTTAGVRNIVSSDTTWPDETLMFQKRLTAAPAAISFPETRDQVASSLACARQSSVKAVALGAAHSFTGFGYGNAGNLVINLASFDEVSYSNCSDTLTFGGGTHVGPVLKYLWDNHGRHIPHVRGAHVGVTGSSIGGGYGSTSRHYGTPMDNIVGVEYMLYNGTVVNATHESDLLWAAQGAGASFGVILSMTTKTFKPDFADATSFTINLGNLGLSDATKALVKVQDYALAETTPDELAIRWNLAAGTSAQGYFYGNPTAFDTVVAPLLKELRTINSTLAYAKTVLPFWDMEVSVAGAGMNSPTGGALGGRHFYTQAVTTTYDNPLTVPQITALLNVTGNNFARTDMRQGGFLDLWGGISRDISDADTAYAHGGNLWLIRVDGTSINTSTLLPADALTYMKDILLPFEDALTKGGVPLRGFVNYADSELPEAEWSARLYGEENYNRLKQIKRAVDPENLFTNHRQSISA